ncbi:MAG: site-specific integrase [Novosphingobium sp.]
MPAPDTPTLTLAGVQNLVLAKDDLPIRTRREIRSRIECFARVSGRSPADIIADPATIRALADKAQWHLAGYSKASWANVMSTLRRALNIAGVRVHRQRRNFTLDPAWDELLAPLARRDRDELRRFAGWCSTTGIAPIGVTAAAFERFLAFCEESMTQRNPRERAHVARRAWNRAIAIEGSPYASVPAPAPSNKAAMRWTDFPETLRAEIADWSDHAVRTGKFTEGYKPIKQVTLDGYLTRLRVLLTALVESGVAAGYFTSIDQLIDPAMVVRGLEHRLGDHELDDRARQDLHGLVVACLNIGRYRKIDEAHRTKLSRLEKKVRFVAKGMNTKNKERLAALMQPKARRALLTLPQRVLDDLKDVAKPTVRQAQRMQHALQLDILLHLPMRVRNLAELDLASIIVPPIAGTAGRWLISIPKDDVKNKVAVTGELIERPSAIATRFLETHRPVLAKDNSTRLFLGQTGKPKEIRSLAKQLVRFLKREAGVIVHPHLMRHLAAHLYLAAHPGDYATVSKLLGHKKIETTIRFYSGLEAEGAVATYGALVEQLYEAHEAAGSKPPNMPGKKGGAGK